MSVVNRMLQDIDRRLGEDGVQGHRPHPEVRSVSAPARRSRRGPGLARLLVRIVVVAAALVAAWVLVGDWKRVGAPDVSPQPLAVAPATGAIRAASSGVHEAVAVSQPAPAPEPKPEQAAETATSVETGVGVLSRAPSLRLSEWISQLPAEAPHESAPPTVAEPVARAVPVAAPAKSQAPVRVASAVVTSRIDKPVRQVAADETVSAARALWNDGAHEAAVATVRDALAIAESGRSPAATIELARELARLEMAAHRAQAALDVLRRLQATLATDADAWALRGNAEQRLALHREAAGSYLAALRLRPGEPKWMLGAAVSLAADGKLDEARGWVARARERGTIPPAVASYLKEVGIAPE